MASPRRKKPARCAFHEGRRRCPRNGTGHPPLCRSHAILVEDDEPSGGIIADLVGDVFGGALDDVISDADRWLADNSRTIAQNARSAVENYISAAAQKRARPAPPPLPHAEAPRRPPAPQPPPPPPGPTPREILGFPPTGPITRAQIKARQRDLARLFHPDSGGNPRQMQRVNDAAAEMLKNL